MLWATIHLTYRLARRIVVALVGASVVLIGVAMIFLPGPAILVIPAGLAILGLEFAWARHWLKVIRTRTSSAINRYNRRGSPRPAVAVRKPGVDRLDARDSGSGTGDD